MHRDLNMLRQDKESHTTILKSLFNQGLVGHPLLSDSVLLAKCGELLATAGGLRTQCTSLPDFSNDLDKAEKKDYELRNDRSNPLRATQGLGAHLPEITNKNKEYVSKSSQTSSHLDTLGKEIMVALKEAIVLARAGMRPEDVLQNQAIAKKFTEANKKIQSIKTDINILQKLSDEMHSGIYDMFRSTGERITAYQPGRERQMQAP